MTVKKNPPIMPGIIMSKEKDWRWEFIPLKCSGCRIASTELLEKLNLVEERFKKNDKLCDNCHSQLRPFGCWYSDREFNRMKENNDKQISRLNAEIDDIKQSNKSECDSAYTDGVIDAEQKIRKKLEDWLNTPCTHGYDNDLCPQCIGDLTKNFPELFKDAGKEVTS
jgi:hypothetical protein